MQASVLHTQNTYDEVYVFPLHYSSVHHNLEMSINCVTSMSAVIKLLLWKVTVDIDDFFQSSFKSSVFSAQNVNISVLERAKFLL